MGYEPSILMYVIYNFIYMRNIFSGGKLFSRPRVNFYDPKLYFSTRILLGNLSGSRILSVHVYCMPNGKLFEIFPTSVKQKSRIELLWVYYITYIVASRSLRANDNNTSHKCWTQRKSSFTL